MVLDALANVTILLVEEGMNLTTASSSSTAAAAAAAAAAMEEGEEDLYYLSEEEAAAAPNCSACLNELCLSPDDYELYKSWVGVDTYEMVFICINIVVFLTGIFGNSLVSPGILAGVRGKLSVALITFFFAVVSHSLYVFLVPFSAGVVAILNELPVRS